jgi:hypothetical protein
MILLKLNSHQLELIDDNTKGQINNSIRNLRALKYHVCKLCGLIFYYNDVYSHYVMSAHNKDREKYYDLSCDECLLMRILE